MTPTGATFPFSVFRNFQRIIYNFQRDLCLGTVYHWLFCDLGGTDQNVEQLKNNVGILMANQNIQQEQIKEIFKLNNLTKVQMTQNRRIWNY